MSCGFSVCFDEQEFSKLSIVVRLSVKRVTPRTSPVSGLYKIAVGARGPKVQSFKRHRLEPIWITLESGVLLEIWFIIFCSVAFYSVAKDTLRCGKLSMKMAIHYTVAVTEALLQRLQLQKLNSCQAILIVLSTQPITVRKGITATPIRL